MYFLRVFLFVFFSDCHEITIKILNLKQPSLNGYLLILNTNSSHIALPDDDVLIHKLHLFTLMLINIIIIIFLCICFLNTTIN